MSFAKRFREVKGELAETHVTMGGINKNYGMSNPEGAFADNKKEREPSP